MPRKLFKQLIPKPDAFKKQGVFKGLGETIHAPDLWHLNKHAVAKAFAIGLFTAFFPVPGQMLFAAFLAITLRANLPISVVLVWISNPLTIPPMFYITYKLGAWILGEPELHLEFELSWLWMKEQLEDIGLPLLIGCLVAGSTSALCGYLSVRYFWRWHVIQAWKNRKALRLKKKR